MSSLARVVLPHAGDQLPPLGVHQLVTRWEFTPWPDLALAITLVVYLWGMWRVARAHPTRPWPWWRTLTFLAGLAVIVVAVDSSIGVYDDELFSDHMVQHLLLLAVAPPLLLVGRPVLLLMHASRNPLHTWTKRVLRHPVTTAVTFPLVGMGLFVAVVVGTHLSSFMSLTLSHPLVHQGEHLLYLVTGYLFYLTVIGGEPIRWRLTFPLQFGLIAFAMAVDAFTGLVLMQTNYEMFPEYAALHRTWGPSLLADLHLGGAIMWVGGDAIMTVVVLVLVLQVVRGRRRMDNPRWLEQVRVGTLLGGDAGVGRRVRDVDEDDAAFEAYNRHLADLDARQHKKATGTDPNWE